ncbi:MAG: hypothetical protein JSS50_03205 [Proteobacteria bacterium]|nr:hypothetical protein [Pseudomonadota bacterium]
MVSSHVPLRNMKELDDILCWQYKRSISKDYVIRFQNRFFQLSRKNDIYCPTRQKVLAKKLLDGSIKLFYDEIE